MFIWLRVRFDGLFGRFPRGKNVLKSACCFTSFLFFLSFLLGILFLEPDLHGIPVYFVAFSMVCVVGVQEEKTVF